MVGEFIGKYIATKLLNSGLDVVKEQFKSSPIVGAFEKACEKVIQSEPDILNKYSSQTLMNPVGIPQGEDLASHLDEMFENNSFPRYEELAGLLLSAWRTRRQQLAPEDAGEFFLISEERVEGILKRIAGNFFRELTLIQGYALPFLVQEVQRISSKVGNDVTGTMNIDQVEDIIAKFSSSSNSLFSWPSTLGNNRWLDRPESLVLTKRIQSTSYSTTLLLGLPGSGKSALLSTLGKQLQSEMPVIAIKADKVPNSVDDRAKLQKYLNLPADLISSVEALVLTRGKVLIIVDQLDALSDLVDLKSERLNVLLDFIQDVSKIEGVHIICSSRWFEYRHDTRLTTISAELLELNPVPWETVKTALDEAGVDYAGYSPEVQEMLSLPLHLKLFLDQYSRNQALSPSTPLYGLLENIWAQNVLKVPGVPKRLELIDLLTHRMVEEEELWEPKALADPFTEALDYLIRQDLLVLDDTGMRIGFRHQSYFDFSRARIFAAGQEKLADYILARQDGLFIRPILLKTLDYLRNASPKNYHLELQTLWGNPSLRTHVRSLLTEYIAALDDPDVVEIGCIRPLLNDWSTARRPFIAMAGSKGWFRIISSEILPVLMSSPPEMAQLASSVLIPALAFERKIALALIDQLWLSDPAYDGVVLHTLRYLTEWDEYATKMICTVVQRTSSWNVPHIADVVSQFAPDLAPKIIRADLERKLTEAVIEDSEEVVPPSPGPEASFDVKTAYAFQYGMKRHFRQLLEGNQQWDAMTAIAESAPNAFLAQVWPWFLNILKRITDNTENALSIYFDDHSSGTKPDRDNLPDNQPVVAIDAAIRKLAKDNLLEFQDFLSNNMNSEFLAVHRLLSRGLLEIASSYPKVVIEYLLANPRRFAVGDYSDYHKESKKLISAVIPFLDSRSLASLENAILKFKVVDESTEPNASERFELTKMNRKHRLRLLRAFPENLLSSEASDLRAKEERVFKGLPDWGSHSTGAFWVESVMSPEQMERAKDEDILNLLEKLDDSTGWDHPKSERQVYAHVGGIVQASRALEVFAEKHPERGAKLALLLEPGKQEIAAGAIIKALGKSNFPSEKLFSLIHQLDKVGFASERFRIDVAQSMSVRAEQDKGLHQSILDLMESWLPDCPFPSSEKIHLTDELDRDISGSVLWDNPGAFSYGGGRDFIFEAIARGYQFRVPQDSSGWTGVLDRALEYEEHPDVWTLNLENTRAFFRSDPGLVTKTIDRILSKFSIVAGNVLITHTLANILPAVPDPEIVRKWLKLIRDGNWKFGPQAFGELLMFYLCCKQGDSWAKSTVDKIITNPGELEIKRGLAFSAARNWGFPICMSNCSTVILSLANSDDEKVQEAISRVFHFDEKLTLTKHMRDIIQAVLPNDHIVLKSASRLIEGLESHTKDEPELVNQVCSRFLDAGIRLLSDMGGQYAYLAEPLVSIALTLHRMPSPHRQRGLNLFEQLIEAHIQEAQQALEDIDRKPIRSRYTPPPRRRRRRRRSKPVS